MGKSPQSQSLLFSFDEGDWNRCALKLVRCDPWRYIEPIAAIWRPQVFPVLLRLTVLTHGPIGIVAPYAVIEWSRLTWEVIRNQHTCTSRPSPLADNFAAFAITNAPQHGLIRDLARDP